jgi:hypothetical protein
VNIEQDLQASPPQSRIELWRELETILAEWRAAERRLAATLPGSAEHAHAATEVAHLRERYQHAYSIEYPERDQG